MATSKAAQAKGEQTIEQLQDRYARLNTQKIQSETKLEAARQQLEMLKRDAREKYGTDDLAALREKLEQMKAENERKRSAYQADLDRIETELAQVEEKFAAAEAGTKGAS